MDSVGQKSRVVQEVVTDVGATCATREYGTDVTAITAVSGGSHRHTIDGYPDSTDSTRGIDGPATNVDGAEDRRCGCVDGRIDGDSHGIGARVVRH